MKPIEAFEIDRHYEGGYTRRCRPCANDFKRRQERATTDPESFPAIERAVEAAPDHRPAVRLRVELERQRGAGRSFRVAWPIAVRHAVRGLPPIEARDWREVFSGTRVHWQATYSGLAWPATSSPSMFLPDDDRQLMVA